MSAGPSACVVGGGALGLCSALALRARGATPVTVIERRHPAAGSSGLSAGIVETQYLDPLDIELRVRSMAFFEHLQRHHGLELARNGYLRLGHDARAAAKFVHSVAIQRELGVAGARVLDRAGVARLIPELSVDDVQAGLFGPDDGYLDGHLYCALLADLCRERGVEIRQGSALRGAERTAAGDWRLAFDGGSIECEAVIDAAGPWAGRVARLLGCELDLVLQRRQAVTVHLPRSLPYAMPSVMDHLPGAGRWGLYFRHEGDGRLIAGLHGEEPAPTAIDPDGYARGNDEEFLVEIARLLAARLPSLADARLGAGWAGLYPGRAGGGPFVGPIAPDGSVVAVGGGGSGIQLSPVLGELAADWAIERSPVRVAGAEALRP